MDELISATTDAPGCRLLSGVTAVSVRFLPGDTAAQAAMLALGLPWVKSPGEMAGSDPLVCWCGPQELVCVGLDAAPLNPLLASLAPGRQDLALAIDISEAIAVFELHGPQLDRWLHHLVDAAAVPMAAGCVTRCRFADVSALLLRHSIDRLWLVVERPFAPYASNWLLHAHAGALVGLSAPDPAEDDQGHARLSESGARG